MYAIGNPPTKKALKALVEAGTAVPVYQPGPFPGKRDGRVTVEGPHFPKPHRWYATVDIVDGVIVKVVA
jgi:hypothetical protein